MTATLITSRSPQRPDDVVLEAASSSAEQVRAQVASARLAAADWRRRPAGQRADALAAVADALVADGPDFAALIVREVGKTVAEARAEVARAAALVRYFAQQAFDPLGEVYPPSAGGLLFTQRHAHGVAGLITPWNFPLAIPLWKAAPALAFGNGVVLKPAPAASATALRLGGLLNAALPAGLAGIVLGDAEAGAALVATSDCVSFTGSTRVGASVVRAAVERGVPVQAEMGGQNAAIVFSDADPQQAADQVTTGAFSYAGQKCTATRRVILVGDCSDFVDALVARTSRLTAGDPADERTDLGPLIDATAHESVMRAVAAIESQGGRLLTDRHVLPDDGYFVAPTLVDGLPDEHRLLREEVFGPVCAVLHVSTEAEAVRLANSVRYGLVTGIYTADLDHALRLIDDLETGVVKVNAPTTGVDFHLPFGGDKDSSFGAREQGKAARDFYTHSRTVTIAFAGG